MVRATEFCYDCGFYKQYDDDGEMVDGCTHPENDENYCTAAGCPLGPLAEKCDFIKAGMAGDYEEGEFIVIYKKKEE